jgi:hypothetical protein
MRRRGQRCLALTFFHIPRIQDEEYRGLGVGYEHLAKGDEILGVDSLVRGYRNAARRAG